MRQLSVTQWRFVVASILTLASCGVVVGLHRQSMRTAVSAHGMLHTAVANQFLEPVRGTHPLENPYFAGEELPYYWIFHWAGAGVARITGLHVLRAFELLILMALTLVWFSAAGLGGRLYGGILPGVAIGFLALAGSNAVGFPALLWKLTFGGAAFPVDGPGYLWGIAHPVMGMARIHDPFALYGPLVNFFLNVTSRPLALALLLLVAWMLWQWLSSGRARSLVGVGLATCATAMFSPIIGLPAGASIVGALVLVGFTTWRVGHDMAIAGRMLAAATVIVLGLGLAAPTFMQLFNQAGEGVELGFRGSPFLGVSISILPLAVLAGIGFRLTGDPIRRSYLAIVTLAALVLLTAAFVTKIQASNDTNFFHAGAFLLAIPAAGVFQPWPNTSGRRQMAGWLVLLLAFVPTPALVLMAYARRPSVPLALVDNSLERVPATSPRARLYRWVRETSDPAAVFIIDPRPPHEMAMGNIFEFPALTGRSLFVAQETSYMVSLYDEADRRHAIVVRLLDGEPLDEVDRSYLDALSRPVFLISREADRTPHISQLQARYGPALFESGPLAVFGVAGTAAGTPPARPTEARP